MNAYDSINSDYLSNVIFITGGTKSGKSEFAEIQQRKLNNYHMLPYQKKMIMMKNGKKKLIYIKKEGQKTGI